MGCYIGTRSGDKPDHVGKVGPCVWIRDWLEGPPFPTELLARTYIHDVSADNTIGTAHSPARGPRDCLYEYISIPPKTTPKTKNKTHCICSQLDLAAATQNAHMYIPRTSIQPDHNLVFDGPRGGEEPKPQLAALILLGRDRHQSSVRLANIEIDLWNRSPIDPER